jgi:hypothetical protein
VHVIQIQAVKADFCLAAGHVLVVLAQIGDELQHGLVAPHPLRKPARKAGQRLGRSQPIAGRAKHETVHEIRVRPVGLDGHGREALFFDEPAGDARPLVVKLVRAVRCLAQQHKARVADPLHQRVIIVRCAPKRIAWERIVSRRSVRVVLGVVIVGSRPLEGS